MIMSLVLWGSGFWIPVETEDRRLQVSAAGTDSWVCVSVIKM